MSNYAIRVEGITKRYRLGTIGYGTLKDDISSFWARIRNKQDPNQIIGEESRIGRKGEFWALRNIDFDVEQGDRVGVIGSNGAGKSTLLKIMSRITAPTAGKVSIKGRISSLLEVGTGFHPELTGRENVFLNGAILGMKRSEILKKFDEIVAFSGVETFIDTPVKRYSSGMYVRLAFSVSAHLDSDILVLDEILAVGDSDFQRKCLGKLDDISKGQGKTVLLVSHNMTSIATLCNKCLVLGGGERKFYGATKQAVELYFDNKREERTEWSGRNGDENLGVLTGVKVTGAAGKSYFETSSEIEITIEFEVIKKVESLIVGFLLLSEYEYELAYVNYDDDLLAAERTYHPGKYTRKFAIPPNSLAFGTYTIDIDFGVHKVKRLITSPVRLSFRVENTGGLGTTFLTEEVRSRSSLFRPLWSVPKKD